MRLVFDIEADNFLENVRVIHTIVAKDIDKNIIHTFRPHEIEAGVDFLARADVLIGHNILGYDIPVLEKLYNFETDAQVWDTLIASRLMFGRRNRHSLESWGQSFVAKGLMNLGKISFNDFTKFTEEMLTYCIQDVEVNATLFKVLDKRGFDFTADYVVLEHDILKIQVASEAYGVTFDYDTAMRLTAEVSQEMDEIQATVEEVLGYSWEVKQHLLKKDGTPNHHAIKLRDKLEREFPELAPHHISVDVAYNVSSIKVPIKITLDTKVLLTEKLLSLGWEPEWTTKTGQPQLTRKGEPEPNLSTVEGFGGTDVGKYFALKHRLALLQGLFKFVRADGKIPSEANTLGAITGRYTHRKIANFPAVRSLLGAEIRGLFSAADGRVQVGADLAGIEARMLAHYMGDDDYTNEVLNGDIHTANQIAAGLPTRDSAKVFFYGFLYGAGDTKVGELVNGGAAEGKQVKEQFLDNLPSLKELIEEKQDEAKAGYVISLDGREVQVTKSEGWDGRMQFDSRKALNTLLQSSATIFFKRWIWFADRFIKERGLDVHLMISYHDEGQWDCHPDHVEAFKEVLYDALHATDDYYQVKCRNDIDIKTGKNWMDCH